MKDKLIGSGITRTRRKETHFTASLLMMALVVISVSLLSVSFLVHRPVGADTEASATTEVASPEASAERTGVPSGEAGTECSEDWIEPISILPYAGHSFAYGGFFIAEAMWDLTGVKDDGCLSEM